jgi:hypothetical protein
MRKKIILICLCSFIAAMITGCGGPEQNYTLPEVTDETTGVQMTIC